MIIVTFMKRRFAVTSTIGQTESPALLDSWITNTSTVKMLCPQDTCFFFYFRKNIRGLNVCLLRIGEGFRVVSKIVFFFLVGGGYDKLLFREGYVDSKWFLISLFHAVIGSLALGWCSVGSKSFTDCVT